MELIVVRHGETDWNKAGRCQGVSDIPLNTRGIDQAYRLADSLRKCEISSIYSSGLKRATQTAEIIAGCRTIPVFVEERFKEMDQGEFEGKILKYVKRKYPHILKMWIKDQEGFRIPGGETLGEVQKRVWEGFGILCERYKEKGGKNPYCNP